MKQPSVLHVIPSVAVVRGGPSHAVVDMVASLIKQGMQAVIATTNDNGAEVLDVPLYKQTDYKGVPTYFFPRFSPNVHAVREFAFSGALTHWLWQNAKHYDVIHVHAIFSYASTAAMTIARLQKVPYIVRPLGQLCNWSLEQSAIKKKLYLRLIERANLSGCDRVHLTSVQEQTELTQLSLQANSVVIPHGIEVSSPYPNARHQLRQHLNLPLEQPIVLFLSRFHPKKGLEYLIPALAKLEEEAFTFILAGSGEAVYEEEIKDLVERYGLTEHTVMPGFVSGDFKQLLLQGADLFALTSHSENFGVCVLEAIAAGLPVLVTPGVALSHEVKQYQLGSVVSQNPEDIATAITSYLHTTETVRTAHRQYARTFVTDHYAWDAIATQLIDTYYTVTNQTGILNYA